VFLLSTFWEAIKPDKKFGWELTAIFDIYCLDIAN
jgi:hypothetical protein